MYLPDVSSADTAATHETGRQPLYFLSLLPSLENRSARRRSSRRHPAIRMTPRHYRVLDLLLLARALESNQLRIGAGFPLGPNSYASYRRTLTAMFRARLVSRLPRRFACEPMVYLVNRLSFLGLRVLAARWGREVVQQHSTAIGSLPHLLGINELLVRVIRSCDERGWNLANWLTAEDLAGYLSPEQLIPDAYCHIRRDVDGQTKNAHFFVEVQRANRSVKVLRSKLMRYGELYYSGRYTELFGTRALRLLFVYTSDTESPAYRRIEQGVREADKLGVTIARFTALDRLKALPPVGVLIAPIWHSPLQDAPMALFDITDGSQQDTDPGLWPDKPVQSEVHGGT
jgi:hypothetical protein